MRRSFVALALVLGSMLVPSAPAAASHCSYPFIEPNPVQDPKGWVNYQIRLAQWLVCELSHR